MDSAGTGYVRQSYEAFGLPRDGTDWDGAVPGGDQSAINAITRRGYTGHSMLGSMGLIHMNGRVYDATLGRFLSADPTIPNPGFTQSFNRYAYVNNNPLSYIDPSGFSPEGCVQSGEASCMELPTVDVIAYPCRAGASGEACGYYAGPPLPAQADPYCEANYSPECYGSLEEEGVGFVDRRAESAAAARNAVTGIVGWIKCRVDPDCRPQQLPQTQLTELEEVVVNGKGSGLQVAEWQMLLPFTVIFNIIDYNESRMPGLATIDAMAPIGRVKSALTIKPGDGKKAFDKVKEFRRWFHKELKGDTKATTKDRSNPDLDLDEAYEQWINEGRPKGY